MAFSDVQKIVTDLDAAGVLDLDKPLKSFLAGDTLMQMGAGEGINAEVASGYVAVWEHYAVVVAGSDLGRVIEELRAADD